jgi:hypothetical protein
MRKRERNIEQAEKIKYRKIHSLKAHLHKDNIRMLLHIEISGMFERLAHSYLTSIGTKAAHNIFINKISFLLSSLSLVLEGILSLLFEI